MELCFVVQCVTTLNFQLFWLLYAVFEIGYFQKLYISFLVV